MSDLHPKTGAAAIGAFAGILLTGILNAAGVHISPDLAGAISGVLSAALSWLTPSPPTRPIGLQTRADRLRQANNGEGENWS